MITQSTVIEEVSFTLKFKKVSKEEIKFRAEEALKNLWFVSISKLANSGVKLWKKEINDCICTNSKSKTYHIR